MQEKFTYSVVELESIRQSLSQERLGPYLNLAANDLCQAILLYERNTSLSEALYGLLQGLEVSLRNSMHSALARGLAREDWYDSIVWQVAQQEQIDNAKVSLKKRQGRFGRGAWSLS
jgi:hypothetical protein